MNYPPNINDSQIGSKFYELFQSFLGFLGYLIIILTLGGISFNRSYSNQFSGLSINVNEVTEYSVIFTENVILYDSFTIFICLLILLVLGIFYFILPRRFENFTVYSLLYSLLSFLMLLSIISGGFFGEEQAYKDQSSNSQLPSIDMINFSNVNGCKDAEVVFENDIDNPFLLYTTEHSRYIIQTTDISKENFKKRLTPTFYISNRCIITMKVTVNKRLNN